MPTAVNGQLYYSQDEVQAGLPRYHAALRQATGYTGQFSADPTQKFQQYITGATPEQQAAARRLADIYGSGSFGPGPTTRGLMTGQELPGQGAIQVVRSKPGSERPSGVEMDIGRVLPIWREPVRPPGGPDIGRVPPIWRGPVRPIPSYDDDRNWGANQDKNQWIAQQTGYGGDFGGGGFSDWASRNGVNVAALEQQWSQQQPMVPERNALSQVLPIQPDPLPSYDSSRNWGANRDKNQWIAQQTGYGGDFGGGGFSDWASQNGVNVAALEQQWSQQGAVTEPFPLYEDPGSDRNWGANQEKNQWIAQQTGYGGDFGGGGFTAWAGQNGVNVAALEQQWDQQRGLGTGQQGLMTGITGLETGQRGLMTGITGLETGQQGLMTGITGLETGQQGLMTGQQTLGAGQGAIQGAIGAPAEGQPQTLFSGQAGLMGGQQALGQQLTGGIQDITGAVGGVSQNIDALEQAAQQYQREAQRQRAQIQTAGIQGREQLSQQVSDVGQQVNTGVEQQRSLMGGMAAPVAAMGATAGIQPGGATQAATQYAQTQKFTPPAQGQQTIMGPMGPMTVDPRDQVTRPVSSSGLMNYPV
jgi:hypothetical protein